MDGGILAKSLVCDEVFILRLRYQGNLGNFFHVHNRDVHYIPR